MEYKVVKGTRDFLPLQMRKRNYIFDTIKSVYHSHGFVPIETPALENLSTLMGKYGEEGDKLLFKVLNSGDFLKPQDYKQLENLIDEGRMNKAATLVSEKGLRYDLTVPFARFVVNHQNEITFPFKRYQIQPVYRADRPQKGRYREFYQCDADIVGSDSLLNEVELIEIISEVFALLGLKTVIKINNRKILSAISQIINRQDKLTQITVAIDKMDKVGLQGVEQELLNNGLAKEDIDKLKPVLLLQGSNEQKIESLKKALQGSEIGQKGIEELEYVLEKSRLLNIDNLELDITLARGLNYYTGAIVEVKACEVNIGSITGGGRYDNLTGIFGLKDVSGVGISFGADRIYDCLEELDLFPKKINNTTDVLLVNFGDKESERCLQIAKQLRKINLSVELYPDSCKMQKQMKYANNQNIPYVMLLGQKELEESSVVVKNMLTGEQQTIKQEEVGAFFRR